ncbi:MAG: ATP-dependent zinc metalloprotease FtsH [Hydrogenoanaerobacterium sp.]
MNTKKTKGIGIYIIILLVVVISAASMFSMGEKPPVPRYQEIIGYFQDNKVKEYSIDLGTGELNMQLRTTPEEQTKYEEDIKKLPKPQNGKPVQEVPKTAPGTKIFYKVPNVSLFIQHTEPLVTEYNAAHPNDKITFDYIRPKDLSFFAQWGSTIFLLVIMVAFWFMMMRQAGGGAGKAMSFAKMKVKSDDGRKTTFADVAGAEEEKEELCEVVEFLKDPRRFNELGARIPKGVLLVGPPGTGKTLLARAVAGEAGVPFFSISGSDFVEMFVGVGASRVRDLFEQAKKNAPSIIFIDEIDAVGRQRGAGLGGGHDEREQTLNQLLVEMDGFGANIGVIIIAATNRADILDHALLRPGRFDRQVYVGYPDVRGREEILKVHTRNKPLGPDVDLQTIAKTTVGFTGADLENLANESALLAARRGKKAITMMEIEEATIKVVAGPEKKSHKVNDRDKNITAYHEAGHAVVTYGLPSQDPVHQVSIIPRGSAAGYTMSLPVDEKTHVSKKTMQENIVVLLGGRVAEKLVLDDICTGASNDIERATKTARQMVTRYGFSEKLGPIVYGTDDSEVFLGRDFGQSKNYSENVAAEIDSEIREIIDNAYERAREILSSHMEQLHKVAKYLLRYEKIDGEVFKRLMEDPNFPDEAHEREMDERARDTEAREEAAKKATAEAIAKPLEPKDKNAVSGKEQFFAMPNEHAVPKKTKGEIPNDAASKDGAPHDDSRLEENAVQNSDVPLDDKPADVTNDDGKEDSDK